MITYTEIEKARRRLPGVRRASIDVLSINPDDPDGEPCWIVEGEPKMISTRALIERAGANAAESAPPTRPTGPIRVPGGGYATSVAISAISLDGGTQPRAQINPDVVQDYADALRAGAPLPPITIYNDGAAYWLADGFHRLAAARAAGHESIWADIKQGTQRDAILYSAGANATHGLRRTNGDKRRAIERLLTDAEWRQWSDAEIARRCAVDPKSVAAVRRELAATMEIPESTLRRGADGRTIDTANIGRTERTEHPERPEPPTPAPPAIIIRPVDPAPPPPPSNGANEDLHAEARARLQQAIEERKASALARIAEQQATRDAVIAERQQLAAQVKTEVLEPAAAALAAALMDGSINAWRIGYHVACGQDAPDAMSRGALVETVAAWWINLQMNYNDRHDPSLAAANVSAFLGKYGLPAQTPNDYGNP